MRTVIMLILIAIVMVFVAGCGPGEPFEIEGRHNPQIGSPTHVVAVR